MPINKEADLIRVLKRSFPFELVKVHGSQFNSGEPDLLGCYKGHMVQIETKIDPNHVSPLQAQRLKFWTERGAYVTVISYIKSIDQVWVLKVYRDAAPCVTQTALSIVKRWKNGVSDCNDIHWDTYDDLYNLPWIDGRKGKVDVSNFMRRLESCVGKT